MVNSTETREERVEKINGLLKMAFGKDTCGSVARVFPGIPLTMGMNPKTCLFIFGNKYDEMGRLNDQGNVIRTFPKYRTQAELYGIGYEMEFGDKPTIIIEDNPLKVSDW